LLCGRFQRRGASFLFLLSFDNKKEGREMTSPNAFPEPLEENFSKWLEFVRCGDSQFQFDLQVPANARCLATFTPSGGGGGSSLASTAHVAAVHVGGVSCVELAAIVENVEKRAQRPRVTALVKASALAAPPTALSISADSALLAFLSAGAVYTVPLSPS
jgi:hypothetical protein